MLARRYEFYVLVARTISHSFASLTREILFLPLEHKIHIFSPPCNILYIIIFKIWNEQEAGKIYTACRFLVTQNQGVENRGGYE